MNATARPAELLDVFTCPLADVNLIEASAGTGKTWTICGLYLRLLLEREFSVQEILVVTFTNAATAELRERIRTRILELLKFLQDPQAGGADPFIGRLAGDLLARPGMARETLTARLELALHSFDEAAIFTIHGFCQRALADNPFAAGLPMRTELVESDRDLLEETVYDFWRRHVAHDATPDFARYIAARGDSPKRYARLLQRHLAKPLARHVWPADLDDPPLAAARVHESYRTARTSWLAHRADIGALLTASLDRLNGTSYKPAWLLDAATHWDSLCRDDDPLAAIGKKAHLFRSSFLAGKTKIDTRTKKKHAAPEHVFFDQAEAYLVQREALDHSLFLARCRLLKRLFAEGATRLQTLKRSRQVVAFNDMLANVHERLHHRDYPWLAASIRTRFPAALIDEFQDTDPLQLGIFRRIYETGDSPVFLVGDPKQAIYGFRHADLPQLSARLALGGPAVVAHRQSALERTAAGRAQRTVWRQLRRLRAAGSTVPPDRVRHQAARRLHRFERSAGAAAGVAPARHRGRTAESAGEAGRGRRHGSRDRPPAAGGSRPTHRARRPRASSSRHRRPGAQPVVGR